jgi:uncharacterized membrane protein
MYYGPAVMKDAGFAGDSNTDLLYSMIFLSGVNAVGNFTGLSLSSKYGRRELIMKCMIPMGIALLILAGAMAINSTMSSPTTSQCIITSFLPYISYWLALHCLLDSVFVDILYRIRISAMDHLRRDFPSKS